MKFERNFTSPATSFGICMFAKFTLSVPAPVTRGYLLFKPFNRIDFCRMNCQDFLSPFDDPLSNELLAFHLVNCFIACRYPPWPSLLLIFLCLLLSPHLFPHLKLTLSPFFPLLNRFRSSPRLGQFHSAAIQLAISLPR